MSNMTDEFDDIFDDDGELALPTMRGSANLDVQDYQGWSGASSILDDDLQEDTPSTPGRNPGAASATDVEGTDDFDFLDVPDGMDAPGMKQTTYGGYPWRPGSESGYRPYSQQRTGMDLRALGGEDEGLPAPSPRERDSMYREPEVIDAVGVAEPLSWQEQQHGNRNAQPSNAEVDPMTMYDRTSYERPGSSQSVIGNGIFGMEEGVTWRARDGSFANQYAMPAYLAQEDELGVQQSEMWDSTAAEWRVTQPSAGGVTLARRVGHLKPPPHIFRAEATGPRSHIEAFGRDAARAILREAKSCHPSHRPRLLAEVIETLSPGSTPKVLRAADDLTTAGYAAEEAFEDVLAHAVMDATVKDLTTPKRRGSSLLPRLDRVSKKIQSQAGALRTSAAKHIAPLTKNKGKLREDLGALAGSASGRALGEVVTDASTSSSSSPLNTRNVMIAGAVGLGAYLLFANREAITKNIKKMVK